jgi:hypothetical protein
MLAAGTAVYRDGATARRLAIVGPFHGEPAALSENLRQDGRRMPRKSCATITGKENPPAEGSAINATMPPAEPTMPEPSVTAREATKGLAAFGRRGRVITTGEHRLADSWQSRLRNAFSITVQTRPLTERRQHFTKEKRRYIKGLQWRIIPGACNGRA